MNVYSIEMVVSATVYIKAGSPADALAKAKTLHGDCLNVLDAAASEVPVSALPFDHPDLPEVSFSPVMTIWTADYRTVEIAADNANRAEG